MSNRLVLSAFLTLALIALVFDRLIEADGNGDARRWLIALIVFFLAQIGAMLVIGRRRRHGVTR